MSDEAAKHAVKNALGDFAKKPLKPLRDAAISLLESLGYRSEKRLELKPNTPKTFLAHFENGRKLNVDNALLDDWQTVDFLFQLTEDEIKSLGQGNFIFEGKGKYNNTVIESYLFFAIALKNSEYTRTQLSGITREINKLFRMPAMLLFRHGETLTLSIINRRLHKRDESKDVLEKVTLIKDIRIADPHRAHIEILFDLSLEALHLKHGFTNFVELHEAWRKTLDSSELNKRFFQEIANWYFWASDHVKFPKPKDIKDADAYKAQSLIRLITRLIFCWFVKEKGLLPDDLFNPVKLQALLKEGDKLATAKNTVYYKAILQNLFFATLNREMNTPDEPDNRKFRGRAKQKSGRDQHHMIHNVYRYEDAFQDSKKAVQVFSDIPFLNGGLFECLDKSDEIRIDGFSDRDDNPLAVPDFLFFGDEREVDLSAAYGETRFKRAKVRGLIHTFYRYKFTITENTPIEEEIALDPELAGKVFENLLAAYNPETSTTARKQTGSFYTPREIVNYMVDESLIACLKTKLESATSSASSIDERLRHLFAYNDQPHQFAPVEVDALIEAIDHLKILDPACGSGAFPMGVLHKLVFVLGKLDPGNERWKARQIAKMDDPIMREQAEKVFRENYEDYGRKLYLIENCIYGVDIQPIAVQIAKLRFFISLVVDQRVDPKAENLGVRPLPNLETKFVAANTLLGIDRPEQAVLRNPAIDQKEKELAEVRRNHFTARTPKTKAKYRDLDTRLRTEISELLKKDGFPRETTEKLAHWDPYDQNASADFFDPEWMFGLSGGFDIVIGNPPYGADIDDFLPLFERLYPNTTKAFKDIYKLFIEAGLLTLTKQLGALSYITPNTLLRQPRYKDARAFLRQFKLLEVLDLGLGIFEQVVPTCVFTVQKFADGKNVVRYRDLTVQSYFSGNIHTVTPQLIRQDALLDLSYSNVGITTNSDIASKLHRLEEILDFKDAGINYQRVNVGLSEKGRSDLGQRLLYEGKKENAADVEFWKGEDIDRYYTSLRTGRFVRIGTIQRLRENERVILNKRYFEQVPKLIWRQTAPWIVAALDTDGRWFGRSIQAAMIKPTYRALDYRYVLAVLNSRYLRFVYNHRVQEEGRVFPQIKFENVKPLPFPCVSKDEQTPIIELANKILAAKKCDPEADTTEWEREIDRLVYELYGLTTEEIAIVEDSARVK